MPLRLFHHLGFAAPIGDDHVMPMRKFALVAEAARRLPEVEIVAPVPVSIRDLAHVHTSAYIASVQTGLPRELAESQKFPWSPALYPSVLLTNGGALAAAEWALEHQVSGALASGFHHSFSDHGEGFCTFNGLIVALESLKERGKITTAAILDLDLHYGNGTASLASSRPWIQALSIYGNDYADNKPFRDVTVRQHADGENHRSTPLIPSGRSDRENLLQVVDNQIRWLVEKRRPDLLFYQAGADSLRDDPYSPLNLTHDDLRERDRRVFTFAREHGIPVAWVLAGGYTPDINKVVEAHMNTVRACCEVYNFS